MENSNLRIFAYNSHEPLTTLGNNARIKAEFYVIEGHSGNLLSFTTSEQLNLITLNTLNTVYSIKTNNQYWKNKYPNVFSDKIGKLKNFKLKFHIDKSVKPVQAKQRNHPVHLKTAIEEEIQLFLDEDIIEEVRNEPSEWLSETVKVGTNKVRIFKDMKAADRAVIREKYLIPDVDNIIYKANGMIFFNKIDLN